MATGGLPLDGSLNVPTHDLQETHGAAVGGTTEGHMANDTPRPSLGLAA